MRRQRHVEIVQPGRQAFAGCLDNRFLPGPAAVESRPPLALGHALEGAILGRREETLRDIAPIVDRLQVLEVDADRASLRHAHQRAAVGMTQVEVQAIASVPRFQHGFAVCLRTEPDVRRGYRRVAREYVSQSSAPDDPAVPEFARAKASGPFTFIGSEQ